MTDMDIAETARLLGVSERTVRRWLRQGRLAGYRLGGRIRISEQAAREAARPYGTTAVGEEVRRPTDTGPILAWLTSPERLRERRERAALLMDEIRASSKPPGGPNDTAQAYLRQMRAEQDEKADRILGLGRH